MCSIFNLTEYQKWVLIFREIGYKSINNYYKSINIIEKRNLPVDSFEKLRKNPNSQEAIIIVKLAVCFEHLLVISWF